MTQGRPANVVAPVNTFRRGTKPVEGALVMSLENVSDLRHPYALLALLGTRIANG